MALDTEPPEPGTIFRQTAHSARTHLPVDITFEVVKYIVAGGWSHVNLVRMNTISGEGAEANLQQFVGKCVVWKRARQDDADKYDELAAHAGLSHPNMAEMLMYRHDRLPGSDPTSRPHLSTLLTPYIPTTLEAILIPSAPIPEPIALAIIRQLLTLLVYLTTPTETYNLVVHRDIKASNVLLRGYTPVIDDVEKADVEGLKVVLCDFGAAQKVKAGEMYPTMRGDLGIRAPEQLILSPPTIPYTSKIDTFATGLLLARMLLGRPLYERKIDQWAQDIPGQLEEVRKVVGVVDTQGARGKMLTALFQTAERQASTRAVDLLAGLLALDPVNRLGPGEALAHPIFTES